MSYEVRIAGPAARYLRRLDARTQGRMRRRLKQIAEDPFGRFTKPLSGPRDYRAVRVGGWRIIFTADSEAQVVTVLAVAPRGQAYRDL